MECGTNYIKGPGDDCNGQYWNFKEKRCYRPVAPCGAIANSMFTDTFKLQDSSGQEVPWTYEGLLWEKDLKRFKNPKLVPGDSNLCDAFNRVCHYDFELIN